MQLKKVIGYGVMALALLLPLATLVAPQANLRAQPVEQAQSEASLTLAKTPEAEIKTGVAADTELADCISASAVLLRTIATNVSSACAIDANAFIFRIGDTEFPATKNSNGHWSAKVVSDKSGTTQIVAIADGRIIAQHDAHVISGFWSLLPALLAIISALLTRQVVPALFLGIWSGAWIIQGFGIYDMWLGLVSVVDSFILSALAPSDGNSEHMSIALFTMLTGGMIGVISRNGGMGGIVASMTRYANTPKKGQAAAGLMGLAIFFDDYANTLIVGNTLRPLMDKLRVSREKLAYLVDSTAAPIACVALVTTWIGFQLSLVNNAVAELPGLGISGYTLMVNSIPYSFYPILTIVFVAYIVVSGRDFGPMYQAERAARKLKPDTKNTTTLSNEPMMLRSGHPMLAVLPIIVLLSVTVIGLFVTGEGHSLREIFGSADPFKTMMWASMLSLLSAIIVSIASGQLSMEESIDAMQKGFHPMLIAVVILTFAWAIADVNQQLHTAEFIVSLLGERIEPALMPAMVFIIASITAFATGASWGTMGILVPLVIPLSWTVMQYNGIADVEHMHIMYATLASVLAGAVWGDHCSPISDTTILSSISSGCDHISHVKTQMPYATTVAMVSLACATIPNGYGVPWYWSLMLGAIVLAAIVRWFGKTIPDYT